MVVAASARLLADLRCGGRRSAHQVLGVGHNMDHHHAGSQYRLTVLDWARNLSAGAGTP
jgi:hypothetical protein